MQIERRSIDYIPESERHGSARICLPSGSLRTLRLLRSLPVHLRLLSDSICGLRLWPSFSEMRSGVFSWLIIPPKGLSSASLR
jgi:hypothetical protein